MHRGWMALALAAFLAPVVRAEGDGAFEQLIRVQASSPKSAGRAFDGQLARPTVVADVGAPEVAGSTNPAKTKAPPTEADDDEPGTPPSPVAPPQAVVKPKPKDEIPQNLKKEVSAEGRRKGGLYGGLLGGGLGAVGGIIAAGLIGGPWGVVAGLAIFAALALIGYFGGRALGEHIAQNKAKEELQKIDQGG